MVIVLLVIVYFGVEELETTYLLSMVVFFSKISMIKINNNIQTTFY